MDKTVSKTGMECVSIEKHILMNIYVHHVHVIRHIHDQPYL